MENSGDDKGTYTLKHYLFLLVWWLSLGFALDTNSAILGLALSFIFFAMTAMNVLKKSILIMLAVFILTAIFPPLGFAVACLALIFFLMRITFVIDNWRGLTVGLFAYGIYLIVVIFNSFFYETIVVQATLRVVDFFNAGGETAVETFGQQGVDAVNATTGFIKEALHVGSYVLPLFLAFFFHRLLGWLYDHGYTTDRAFYVIGLTPLVIMAIVLPFLKIDLGGDTLFSGSLADGTDGVAGIDGVNNTIHVPTVEMPSQVTTIMDVANVDMGSWFVDNAAALSPAIESSMATLAVRGIYVGAEKYEGKIGFQTLFSGGVQTIREDDENHTTIKNEKGENISEIIYDESTDTDRILLEDGNELIFTKASGTILDKDGHLMGRIKENSDGDKVLVSRDGKVIRTYSQDGTIKNANGEVVGEAKVAV